MTTFAASKGAVETDWRKVITDAMTNGTTQAEQTLVEKLSAGWTTCATGMQSVEIERFARSCAPLDPDLSDLGHNFYCYIADKDWHGALTTLDAIEARAKELLK